MVRRSSRLAPPKPEEAGDLSSPLAGITINTDTNTVPTPATQSTSGAVLNRAHEEGAANPVAKKAKTTGTAKGKPGPKAKGKTAAAKVAIPTAATAKTRARKAATTGTRISARRQAQNDKAALEELKILGRRRLEALYNETLKLNTEGPRRAVTPDCPGVPRGSEETVECHDDENDMHKLRTYESEWLAPQADFVISLFTVALAD